MHHLCITYGIDNEHSTSKEDTVEALYDYTILNTHQKMKRPSKIPNFNKTRMCMIIKCPIYSTIVKYPV